MASFNCSYFNQLFWGVSKLRKLIYDFFLNRIVVNCFFRDIKIVGAENIPKNKATLIVGIHRNQFVDGMVD